jgi:hypothetical protein
MCIIYASAASDSCCAIGDAVNWQRLSARQSGEVEGALYEGVPVHLWQPLVYWIQGQFGYRSSHGMRESLMMDVSLAARLPIPHGAQGVQLQEAIVQLCTGNEGIFLDVIDALLHVSRSSAGLEAILQLGGSAWSVNQKEDGLQRRVGREAQEAADRVMKHGSSASVEIEQAWIAAFGRDPNPSDAWDHAIKAVEATLIPVVVPLQAKAQFGHVLGQLKTQGDRWNFALPGPESTHGVERLVGSLELLWPNPDRHPGETSRPPTLQEAQCVVHLAVTIVQWGLLNALTKK